MPLTFIANREVRTFPKGWVHPRDERGRFVPLFDADRTLAEAMTQIAAYETTSEGTPITPPFPNTPAGRLALVNFCATNATTFGSNKADAETWAAILFGTDGAAVDTDGRVTFA